MMFIEITISQVAQTVEIDQVKLLLQWGTNIMMENVADISPEQKLINWIRTWYVQIRTLRYVWMDWSAMGVQQFMTWGKYQAKLTIYQNR